MELKLRNIIFIFGIAVIGSLLTWFLIWRLRLASDVNDRLARIRKAGEPTSGAELNAWRRPVPDQENGAPMMAQAFASYRELPSRRFKEIQNINVMGHTNDWTPATRALIQEFVQTNSAALARLHEALAFQRFQYPVDFSVFPASEPHLSPLRNLARVVAFQIALDAESGRADQWAGHADDLLKMARSFDDEPGVISHLVRNAIIGMAANATEWALNESSPGDEARARLQADFIHAGATNLLPMALVGERAMNIPMFRMNPEEMDRVAQPRKPGSPPSGPQTLSGKPVTVLWVTGFMERDLNFYLDTMEKTISLAALPPPESLTLSNQIDVSEITAPNKYRILSSLVLSSISRTAQREANTLAHLRLAATALAIEGHRHTEGRLPATLAELTPRFLDAVPIDPFDGKPLRYKLIDGGYMIYSVDADRHDDGGKTAPFPKKPYDTNTYDITFTVIRP